MSSPDPSQPNQFALLRQRRFAPFFWTQFLGAGNDNLFKFAVTVLLTYQLQTAWLPPALAGLVIGALFILPFLLFSATSGQLADKHEKARLMRFVKSLEVAIMTLAGWGFLAADVPLLLACVFLMGLHSTLFGPVKFAYLPQHLSERELTGGNGMVEMGTFVAILLGSVAGGLLIAIPGEGARYAALACLGLAVVGRLSAQAIPASPPADPQLRIDWNPVRVTWANLKLAHADPLVFRSLLGISWMWFFGAVFLAQFPFFAKEVLHGDERVASLLLVLFSVGIGAGSLLCEVLSPRHVEIGLVPLGAIGMSVFSFDLYLASRGLGPSVSLGLADFVARPAHWRVMADLALLSLFAGIYSVPMYALIQLRSAPRQRARVIAANNILNALFMVVSSLGVGVLLQTGLTIPEVFGVVGLLNAVVAGWVFLVAPEYLVRGVALLAARLVYRLRVRGEAAIPPAGAAILVCNRLGRSDPLLLTAASPRPIRFVMDRSTFRTPLVGRFLRLAGAIPMAPQCHDAAIAEQALAGARAALDEGALVCIFPGDTGRPRGAPGGFDGQLMQLLDTHPVPVIPLVLQNPRGSFFMRDGGAETRQPLRRRVFSRVDLIVGPGLAPHEVSADRLRTRVEALAES